MINAVSIRSKIAQAIKAMPTIILLKRYTYTPDGLGGHTRSTQPVDVATFNGLLDNSSHSIVIGDTKISDAAIIAIGRAVKLYAVWNEDFTINKEDFFVVKNIKYTINNAVNILNIDIYYECDLESEDVSL